ncbi:hypothetical protein Tco_1512672, partial [Tanacetum coccineum]
ARLAGASPLVATTNYACLPFSNLSLKNWLLPSNDAPSLSTAPLVQNEEWINALVDVPSNKMADGDANDKLEDVFMQGVSHAVGNVYGLSIDGSESVSSGPNNVAVSLSFGEKGNGYSLYLSASKEAATAPSRV